jgi:hypothetical protein
VPLSPAAFELRMHGSFLAACRNTTPFAPCDRYHCDGLAETIEHAPSSPRLVCNIPAVEDVYVHYYNHMAVDLEYNHWGTFTIGSSWTMRV